MKTFLRDVFLFFLLFLAWEVFVQDVHFVPFKTTQPQTMKIESQAFQNGGALPSQYSCDGAGEMPPLSWSDIPAETKSLALIVEDSDAPRGTFDHFVEWNIPANATTTEEGIVGKNSLGTKTYVAPCPPSGTHRYFFKLYALDTLLPETLGGKNDLLTAMQSHILDSAELMGTYQKI